jgi:pimeloyl-ACP methyl ester carboxylesterase
MPWLAVPCQLLSSDQPRAIALETQRRQTPPLLLPGTQLQVVAGSGHLLPLKAPLPVASVLLEAANG